MKKLALALALTLGGAIAVPASAAAVTSSFPIVLGPDDDSTPFSNKSKVSGGFDDTFTFTLPAGSLNGLVSSIAKSNLDIIITSFSLDGVVGTRTSTGATESWELPDTNLGAGPHSINVVGTWGTKGGSYSGNLNFTSAVPEPATWGMMMLGFAAVGGTLRRRKAQTSTTVRFA